MLSKFIKNFTHYRLNFVWTLSSGMVKNSHWTFFNSYPDYFSFNKVIFSPEIHAKRSKVWRIPPRDCGEPSVKNDVSSAYCDILYSSPFILMLLMSLSFLIKMPRISAHIINMYGEIRSPCLHPLPGLKY